MWVRNSPVASLGGLEEPKIFITFCLPRHSRRTKSLEERENYSQWIQSKNQIFLRDGILLLVPPRLRTWQERQGSIRCGGSSECKWGSARQCPVFVCVSFLAGAQTSRSPGRPDGNWGSWLTSPEPRTYKEKDWGVEAKHFCMTRKNNISVLSKESGKIFAFYERH